MMQNYTFFGLVALRGRTRVFGLVDVAKLKQQVQLVGEMPKKSWGRR